MHYLWITRAITGGGTLTIIQRLPGKTILSARMEWPGESTICGAIALSVDEALKSLEKKLAEDGEKTESTPKPQVDDIGRL